MFFSHFIFILKNTFDFSWKLKARTITFAPTKTPRGYDYITGRLFNLLKFIKNECFNFFGKSGLG